MSSFTRITSQNSSVREFLILRNALNEYIPYDAPVQYIQPWYSNMHAYIRWQHTTMTDNYPRQRFV